MRTMVIAECGFCKQDTDHLICEDCDYDEIVCEHLECTVCGTIFPDDEPRL